MERALGLGGAVELQDAPISQVLLSWEACRLGPLRLSLYAWGSPAPAPGRINVKNEELEAMVKEAPGPINFTVFLTMFGEKLKGE